jgi:molybdate transport system regulatory protein
MEKQGGHRLTIRIDLGSGVRVGPGKIALLEAIAASGSIAGAGRILKMSYKRAWDLVEELNRNFVAPVVAKAPGGAKGGGAHLTASGAELVKLYREIETAAHEVARQPLRALAQLTEAPD